jgi:hypothetical protein
VPNHLAELRHLQIKGSRGTIQLRIDTGMPTDEPIIVSAEKDITLSKRPSRARLVIAFAVAGLSDLLSFWITFLPPAQWALDAGTAMVLFFILGRRWVLLPGLIAEAIPGMGVFPVWILVVASIAIYDGIKKPLKT